MGGFNFICEADFIRALLGFHRAWRDFIEDLKNSWYNYYKEMIMMAENKLADMSTEFAQLDAASYNTDICSFYYLYLIENNDQILANE